MMSTTKKSGPRCRLLNSASGESRSERDFRTQEKESNTHE